jgi:DNA-directed RNA polymerase beta' subunit
MSSNGKRLLSDDETERPLTDKEIDFVLSFVPSNVFIPKKTSDFLRNQVINKYKKQLKEIKIFPALIPHLRHQLEKAYHSSLIQPGESVGIITAQCIGEKQTQSNLNTFHRAGSADKQPTASKFNELLNATKKLKDPMYYIFFKHGNESVPNLRSTVSYSLVQLTLKKLAIKTSLFKDKEDEKWYPAFYHLYRNRPQHYKDGLTYFINMDILYEYQLTLQKVCEIINSKYQDLFCIHSPDNFGRLDIFVDTTNVDCNFPKTWNWVKFITEENKSVTYLEEVVEPRLNNLILCGIPGVLNMFFLRNRETNEWFIETANAVDKVSERQSIKQTKDKNIDSTRRFKMVLAHPLVNMAKTISNSVWDIYNVFGVEAARTYLIDEFSKIMEGINTCHVMLLVDKMTFFGTISSVSRYTVKRDDIGPFSKVSFEQALDNFLNAAVHGEDEQVKSVSGSIICAKRGGFGTGLCDLYMDLDKLFV